MLATSFAVCFPALLLIALLTFAGGRLGWVPTSVTFGVLGFLTGRLALSGRWESARRWTALGLAVLGGLAGIMVAHWAPPTPGRLRHEIEAITQVDWDLRDDQTSGNILCLDYCISVDREYQVNSSADDVLEGLRPVLARHGLDPSSVGDQLSVRWTDGDLVITLRVHSIDAAGAVVHITAEAN